LRLLFAARRPARQGNKETYGSGDAKICQIFAMRKSANYGGGGVER
jgi:hypothetical protein